MEFFLVLKDTSVPKPVSDSPTVIAKAAVSPEFDPTTELALQNFSKIQTKMDQPERDGLSATTRLMMEILDNPNKVEWAKKHVGQPYADDSFADYAASKMVRRDINQALEWVEYADQEYGLENPNAFKALAKKWISGHGTENLADWLNTNSSHLAWERIAEGFYSNASSMKRDGISTLYDKLNDAGLNARLAERLQELGN